MKKKKMKKKKNKNKKKNAVVIKAMILTMISMILKLR